MQLLKIYGLKKIYLKCFIHCIQENKNMKKKSVIYDVEKYNACGTAILVCGKA